MLRLPVACIGGWCLATVLAILYLKSVTRVVATPYGKGRLAVNSPSPRCCVSSDCLQLQENKPFAVVTSLRSAKYMVSLRDMQCSLKRTNPDLNLIVLAVAGELSDEIVAEIRSFATYREVPNIEYNNTNDARYGKNWFKLNAWGMTEFAAIILLDADTVVLGDISHVFHLPTDFAWSYLNAPDYNWNKGGFIMLRPCPRVLDHMLTILKYDESKHFTAHLAEQTFLSWYYEYTGYRLPMIYNANVNYLTSSGNTAGGAEPLVVHFSENKLFDIDETHRHWHYMCHRYYKQHNNYSGMYQRSQDAVL